MKQGGGFGRGDIVETAVDLKNGKVSWKVNGTLQASLVNEHLQTESGAVVPYLQMCDNGDIVEWCNYS